MWITEIWTVDMGDSYEYNYRMRKSVYEYDASLLT